MISSQVKPSSYPHLSFGSNKTTSITASDPLTLSRRSSSINSYEHRHIVTHLCRFRSCSSQI
ncbi:hypothetical protein Hanom_Chr06g00532671 [Helianthus anomalus]